MNEYVNTTIGQRINVEMSRENIKFKNCSYLYITWMLALLIPSDCAYFSAIMVIAIMVMSFI